MSLLVMAGATPLAARPSEPILTELSTSAVRVVERMPRAVTSFGAAVSDGWLYVLGGYHGVPHEYDREGQEDSFERLRLGPAAGTSEGEGVDALAASWQALPSPGRLQSVALVAQGGRLIRAGGMVARNAPGQPSDLASMAEVASFDPTTREWSALPALPQPRSSHMAAVLGGALYVVGGWTLDGEARDARWCDTVAILDLGAPEPGWREIEAPFRRRGLGVAATRTHLVAVGGMGPKGGPSARVDLYEPATGAWSRGPDLPEAGFGAAAVGVGDDVYVSAADGIVYRLRPGDDRWHCVTSLVFPRIFHQLVAVDEAHLLVLGGIARGGRVAHIESIDLGRDAERDPVTLWELPAPGRAKNRQGTFLVGNRLIAFGGNKSLGQHDFAPENFLDEAFELDLATLQWRALPPLPGARQSMTTVVGPGGRKGYALGGFGPAGSSGRSRNEVVAFDFEARWWLSSMPSLPSPRTQFGVYEHGGSLWLLGGLDYDAGRASAERFQHPTSVLSWNLDELERGFQPAGVELPAPRRAFGGTLLDGQYYLVGGMREDFQPVERCDVLDVETRAWGTIPSPRRPRISPDLVALGGRLYLVGGSSEGDDGELAPDPSIEAFDPGTDEGWTLLDVAVPFPSKHAQASAFGDRLLLYSAHDTDAPNRPGVVRVALIDLDQRVVEPRAIAHHVLR